MKYLKGLLLCLFLTNAVANYSDIKPTNIKEVSSLIATAFESGNADLLKELLSSEIELIIESEKIEFAKISGERAGFIISSFFKNNPPVNFSYIYEGNSSESLLYSVGSYRSLNKDFLVYMLIKENEDHSFQIKTLQMREN